MLPALLLCVLAVLASATTTVEATATPWQDLLVYTCDGSAHLLPNHPVFKTGLNLTVLNDVYQQVQTSMQNRLSCACPQTDKGNVSITVGSLLSAYQTRSTSTAPPSNCPNLQFYDALLSHLPAAGLPNTCDGDSWAKSGTCSFTFPSPLFQSLPASAITLQVNLAQCPGKSSSALPYISLSCSGTACQDLLTPCMSSSDCKSGATCTAVSTGLFDSAASTINNLLVDTLHLPATCNSASAGALLLQNVLSTLHQQSTGSAISSTPSEIKLCGIDNLVSTNAFYFLGGPTIRSLSLPAIWNIVQKYASLAQQYAQQAISYVEQQFSTTVTGTDGGDPATVNWATGYKLSAWDGTLGDGSSVTASSRMAGSTFNNTRFDITVSTAATQPSTILIIENDTRFGLFPSSPLALTGYSSLLSVLTDVHGTFSQLATCSAGTSLSSAEVHSWYDVTTADFWLNALGHGSSNTNALPSSVNSANTPLGAVTVAGGVPAVSLPVTCTAAGFANSAYCQLAYDAFEKLFNLGVRLSIAAPPSDSQLPRIVLDCYGTNCPSILQPYHTKTCTQNSDCSGFLSTCYYLNSVNSPVSIGGILFNQPISSSCESDLIEVKDAINLLASYTHQSAYTFASDSTAGICTVPYSSFFNADNINTVTNAIVNSSPKSSTGVYSIYGLVASADNMTYPVHSSEPLSDAVARVTPVSVLMVFSAGCNAYTKAPTTFINNLIAALASITGAPASQFSVPSVTCSTSTTTTQSHAMQRRLMQTSDSGVTANVIIAPSNAAGAIYPVNVAYNLAAQASTPGSALKTNSFMTSNGFTSLTYTTLPPVDLPPADSSSSGLSAGAIAGIVIGSVVGAALIAGAGTYWYLRHKRAGNAKILASDSNEMVVTA